MSTEFVQTGTRLVNLVEPKIKNYESIECVRKALAAGELHEGEHWTTYCPFTAPTDDVAALVYELYSFVPSGTNPDDNKLVNQCMISELADLTQVKQDITDIKACNTNQQTAIEARVTCTDYNTYTAANDACMACRVQCCDFTDFVTNIDTYVSNRVTCTDYQTCCTAWDTAIGTLSAKPGLDCVGTVVASDIANFVTMSDVDACGYTTCTGTVVASDLTPLSTAIGNLETCPGLDCVGDVVAADISDMATKTCVNTDFVKKACFSLSGNVLTITMA